MSSPFPGMDPYIEALGRWPGFHFDFVGHCMHQLNERLPSDYVATLGDRIELIDDQDLRLRTRTVGPNVAVVRDVISNTSLPTKDAGVSATLEPHTLPRDVEVLDLPRQLFIEITHLPEEKVVTDIEVLSPSNKRAGSEDRLAYLTKRKNLLVHYVNLVEYDLLIQGARLPLLAPLPPGDYYGFVTHGPNWHECDVYAWSVRSPLPTLPVPLLPEDGRVMLDLAAAFNKTYAVGRYSRLLRYPPEPPAFLRKEDCDWARERLASARK